MPANSSAGQITFPSAISTLENNPDRKIFIKDMEIFPVYAQARSVKNNNVVGLAVADIPKFNVTIYYDSANFIRYVPAAKLIYTVPPNNVDSPYQRERVPFADLYPVAIDQCFLQFTTPPSANAFVVPIGVIYTAVKVVS